MIMLILTPDEIRELTGYSQPGKQLAELHRQGFCRARRDRLGRVVVERAHVEAVRATGARFDYSAIIPRQTLDARSARRAEAMVRQTPPWASADEIEKVYAEARRMTEATGIPHHVDHEIPLRGDRVSGLHVAENLRVIPADDNIRKGNKFEPL